MKKILLVLALIVPLFAIIGCNSKSHQKSDEEIISEQFTMIDSLINSNVPITTNTYDVGEINRLELTAKEMIYKGDTVPFLLIYGEWGSRERGIAIIPPMEIKEICTNIDSITKKTTLRVDNLQTVSYSTKGGLTIKADNSWRNTDTITPWRITITSNYQGNADFFFRPEELPLLRNLLMNSYVETDGYKHLNKLSLKNPEIRKNNKFY